MTETPSLTPAQPDHKGIATAALIIGIAALFIPVAGIVLGIVAIVLGAIALKRKTLLKSSAIIGIVSGGVAIIWSAILIAFLSLFAGSFLSLPNDRDRAVTAQISEKKDFTVNETAKLGPVDFKVTKVERDYVPTSEEAKVTVFPKEATYSEKYTSPVRIADEDAEFVLVEASVTRNGSQPLGDRDFQLKDIELNGVEPFIYDRSDLMTKFVGPDTVKLHHVYRIRNGSDELTLRHAVSIYKKVSSIVGTEGMPTEYLIYTIKLQ